jgi:hypothetical protein
VPSIFSLGVSHLSSCLMSRHRLERERKEPTEIEEFLNAANERERVEGEELDGVGTVRSCYK